MTEDEIDQITRLQNALRVACSSLAELNEYNAKLIKALDAALALQEGMLRELSTLSRQTGGPVSVQLRAAKSMFDKTMKELFKQEEKTP
jgi:hypothetical protein